MTSPIHLLADQLQIVPFPPDETLAARVNAWWTQPRTFGCVNAAAAPVWWVLWPSPSVICGECLIREMTTDHGCIYCGTPVSTDDGVWVTHESRQFVEFISRAHARCADEARRA